MGHAILNFGSLNIDHVYRLHAFVRPGETVSSLQYERFPGGKGLNQTIALARAGAAVCHAGKIGPDGLFLAELLENESVDTAWLSKDGSASGHTCIQVDDRGQNCIILHGGANQEIDEAYVRQVLQAFAPGSWIVLQNEISCLRQILQLAAERGMTIVLNPSPVDEELLQLDLSAVSYLILNETEGEDFTGEKDPCSILAAFRKRCPAMHVVLTLGAQGAMYCDAEETFSVPACPVDVVDTTAAGDTFTGYFVAGVSRGETPRKAMEIASAAAALAVSAKGASVSIPRKAEVEKLLR